MASAFGHAYMAYTIGTSYDDKHFTTKEGSRCILFFFFCTLSHSLLDAMTSGGQV